MLLYLSFPIRYGYMYAVESCNFIHSMHWSDIFRPFFMSNNQIFNIMIYNSLTELIGGTPLLKVSGYDGQRADILLKLEYFNPGGSVKDRIAYAMIEDAEAKGLLKPGATIIEPTSGNTGVGLAWVGVSKGYNVILTMPETMSQERRSILKALGARLELTP